MEECRKEAILGKLESLLPYFVAKIGCFLAVFTSSHDGRQVKRGDFWIKWQAYSLNSWLKCYVFWSFLNLQTMEEC